MPDGPSGDNSDLESAMPPLYNPFDDAAEDETSGDRAMDPLWLCSECMCPDWRVVTGGYRCARCGSKH